MENPNLRFHRMEAHYEIMLNPQIALDPFEKQLNVPTLLVKFGNRQRWKSHVVGQEHQKAFLLCIENRIHRKGEWEFSLALGSANTPPDRFVGPSFYPQDEILAAQSAGCSTAGALQNCRMRDST